MGRQCLGGARLRSASISDQPSQSDGRGQRQKSFEAHQRFAPSVEARLMAMGLAAGPLLRGRKGSLRAQKSPRADGSRAQSPNLYFPNLTEFLPSSSVIHTAMFGC
jgi:hypothetical protein